MMEPLYCCKCGKRVGHRNGNKWFLTSNATQRGGNWNVDGEWTCSDCGSMTGQKRINGTTTKDGRNVSVRRG